MRKELEAVAEESAKTYAEQIYKETGSAVQYECSLEDFFFGYIEGSKQHEKKLAAGIKAAEKLMELAKQHNETYSATLAKHLLEILK